jgi:2-aminoadipate transaminase
MRSDAAVYQSDLSLSGPPVFFPEPTAPISFNFDQGLPHEGTFPLDDLAALHREILDRDEGRALEYLSMGWDPISERVDYSELQYVEIVLGYSGLRRELARWMATRSGRVDLTADNFILTSGSVQALALAINALVNPGDGVLVESASFPYALRYMEARGADIRPVDVDEDGLDPKSLRARLEEMRQEGVRPKLLYIIATFQLPTGVCTSLDRRREILELAEEFDFLVIEDNVYGDLRFSGEELPTLLSLDTQGRVLQSNGFSKSVAPGLRLGWMCGAVDLILALAAVRQDLGVSQWTSRVMEEYVKRGQFDAHITEVNLVYKRKRDIAADAVREFCEPWVTFRLPDGGFYLWLEMDSSLDWEAVRQRAELAGVQFRPGERFMTRDAIARGGQFIRLAFSHVEDDELRRGIEVLGDAIKSAAPEASAPADAGREGRERVGAGGRRSGKAE